MFQKLKEILVGKSSEEWSKLVKAGAQIVDVRTKEEYASGHLRGSLNIPLGDLERHLGKLKKGKPVIVCCASGVRSGSAKRVLQAKGYEVYNGGSWASLQGKVKP
jgi:phage shock protein E